MTKRLLVVVLTLVSTPAWADASSCMALTPPAIQQIIDTIGSSRDKAQSDANTNGTNGAYASAAGSNLAYLKTAHDEMLALQSWLSANGLDSPYVTNTSAAYNVHSYVRETVTPLHYARHWAMISMVYHHPLSADARDSFELTSHALALIEPLGTQAGRCYTSAYVP